MRYGFILFVCFLFAFEGSSQTTSIDPNIFNKLSVAAKNYVVDTTTPPDDKLTRQIIAFRNLRGGFNINEAIVYKFSEEEAKATDSASKTSTIKAKESFFNGDGKRWLDNAVIHIYRKQFSSKEMKQMIRFYKTTAGQKLATEMPVLIIQTLMAAEFVQKSLSK